VQEGQETELLMCAAGFSQLQMTVELHSGSSCGFGLARTTDWSLRLRHHHHHRRPTHPHPSVPPSGAFAFAFVAGAFAFVAGAFTFAAGAFAFAAEEAADELL
jgi:hypothetical protein